MKIVTVLGTRPEIIRLSRIIQKLDRHSNHLLVHTGQNSSASLSNIFFSELGLRAPDHHFGINEPDFARQISRILTASHDLFLDFQPDRLLILGDTNSALAGIVAKRLGIPVFHMEAGNRCFDARVPEEVNRRIIDHVSDVLLPYTERSRQNLLREGFQSDRIYVTGNPIYELMEANADLANKSNILQQLDITARKYFLASLHRKENVDDPSRLTNFIAAFHRLAGIHRIPVLVSTHPRTRLRLAAANLCGSEQVRFVEPVGFASFLALEKQACCVLSDSGTVQEECTILRVPSVTLRDVTERPETVECGAAILSGGEVDSIVSAVEIVLANPPDWQPPPEYLTTNVSDTVLKIVAGYVHGIQNNTVTNGS